MSVHRLGYDIVHIEAYGNEDGADGQAHYQNAEEGPDVLSGIGKVRGNCLGRRESSLSLWARHDRFHLESDGKLKHSRGRQKKTTMYQPVVDQQGMHTSSTVRHLKSRFKMVTVEVET